MYDHREEFIAEIFDKFQKTIKSKRWGYFFGLSKEKVEVMKVFFFLFFFLKHSVTKSSYGNAEVISGDH